MSPVTMSPGSPPYPLSSLEMKSASTGQLLRKTRKSRVQYSSEGSPSRRVSVDSRAPEESRARPQINESQSEPILPQNSVNYPNLSPRILSLRQGVRQHRTVSQPESMRSTKVQPENLGSTSNPQQKRRRYSDGSDQDSTTTSQHHSSRGSPLSSTYSLPEAVRIQTNCTSQEDLAEEAVSRTSSPTLETDPDTDCYTDDEKDEMEGTEETDETNKTDHEAEDKAEREANFETDFKAASISLKMPQEIFAKSFTKLEAKATKKDIKLGWIYILHLSGDIYKIGQTNGSNPYERINSQEKCEKNMTTVYRSRVSFKSSFRAEQMIHLDLAEKRKHRRCEVDGKIHGEYFEVSKELAIRTVNKWEAFMINGQPYDWSGNRGLKPIWNHLLKERRLKLRVDNEFTHNARREYWKCLLSIPNKSDYADLWMESLNAGHRCIQTWRHISKIWTHVSTYPWQTATLIYAMVTLALSQNTLSFVALAVTLVFVIDSTHASRS